MNGKPVTHQGQPPTKRVWCVVIDGEKLHVTALYADPRAIRLISVELGGCNCFDTLVELPDDVSDQVEWQLARRPKSRNW